MYDRLQLGMCENLASNRRHDSRLEASSAANENSIKGKNLSLIEPLQNDNHQPFCPDGSPHAASTRAATGEEELLCFRLLTVHEVAAFLRVPVSWVYGRTRKRSVDRLPGYRLGKYWRFREADVQAWLQHQQVAKR